MKVLESWMADNRRFRTTSGRVPVAKEMLDNAFQSRARANRPYQVPTSEFDSRLRVEETTGKGGDSMSM